MTPALALLVLCSPFVGSFLAVVVDRSIEGRPFLFGRSGCDHCGKTLPAHDLIPLFSWLWLRGKSRCCQKPLRLYLPVFECLALLVVIWAALVVGEPLIYPTALLGWLLLVLSAIDLRTYRLPDWATLSLIALGFTLSFADWSGPWSEHLAAAAVGYLTLAGIAAAYRRLRGQEGLGLGDAKLLAAAGAWVGLLALPSVLLIACLAGFLGTGYLAASGERVHARLALPFGPALALGFWITWLYGPLVLA